MLHACGLLLILLLPPAHCTIHADDSRHDAQQQKHTLANCFGVSAKAADAWMTGGFGIGDFRGVGPRATALPKPMLGHSGRFEPHSVKRLLRSGPRRAKVALQGTGNPVLPKEGKYPGIQTPPLQPAKAAFQRGNWPPEDPRIVTTNIGMVMTQFKRRNGVHTEVTVQHPDREPTVHRLWFGFEVLDDVAKVREDPIKSGRQGRSAIDISRFSEAVVGFLEKKGVDLADKDWGMLDESIPFSNEFLPMRTLMDYYPDLPEAVVDACLTPEPETQEPVLLKEVSDEKVMLLTNPFPFGLSPDLDVDRLRKKLEEDKSNKEQLDKDKLNKKELDREELDKTDSNQEKLNNEKFDTA